MTGGDIGPVSGPTEKFAELITPVLRQADLRFGQCERTYSKRGWEPQYSYGPGGQLTRLDPSMAEVWKAANMDVISVASNHAMDWGPEAVLDTVEMFRAMGNVVDRLLQGAVADFLNMSCCGIENPFAFNVADVAIFVGAIGLVIFTGKSKPAGRRKGKTLEYGEVRERVAAQLTMQSRAKALHQYMSLLVGQAQVEGIALDAADSPLVQ